MEFFPQLIQGGMGVGVSNWRLAAAVSRTGALGVVSGTVLDQVLSRRLQDGDPGGHMRRAIDQFPIREMAENIWRRFYVPGGKAPAESYRKLPMPAHDSDREVQELFIVSNFVEVFLARQGHANAVGINYLEKVQIPHLPALYGAMLAGVDYVLMGAGIPLKIPGVLDAFVTHEKATYPLTVNGAKEGEHTLLTFDPRDFVRAERPPLKRPKFLAIVSSHVLAATILKRANGIVHGFVVETPLAGGHNAPPRGKLELTAAGEPVYGPRDVVDLQKMRELGVPFWLAGGYGRPGKLQEALLAGAAGVQVGTLFAFCEESGLRADYKRATVEETRVVTDPRASPTGFPFKVAQLHGTLSEPAIYDARPRICDLGYLREAYRTDAGTVGYRCPGEPVSLYVAKGGDLENTTGRRCLCNALLANIGHAQVRGAKHVEQGLVTAGDDLPAIKQFLAQGRKSYRAADVVCAITNSASL